MAFPGQTDSAAPIAATVVPPASSTPPPPAAPAAPSTPPATGRVISDDEWNAYQGYRAQAEAAAAAERTRLENERTAEARRLANAGNIDAALTQTNTLWAERLQQERDRVAQLDREILNGRLESQLDEVLGRVELVGETPEAKAATRKTLRRLLRDEVEATRDAANQAVVRCKTTHRPAAEVLAERLATAEYAPFLAARGAGPNSRPNGTPPAVPPPPSGAPLFGEGKLSPGLGFGRKAKA